MAKLSITGFHSLESVICLVFARKSRVMRCPRMSHKDITQPHLIALVVYPLQKYSTLDQIQNSLTSMTVETY